MKKIITLSLFAALFCAVSCQHGLDNGQDLSNGLKVEAVISQFGDTRVDYIPQNSEEPYYIDAVWHVGDVIFGFDDQGQKFDFTVESVAAGVATLNVGSYVPGAATTLHAIYYPGKSSTDLEGDSPNYSLPVNLDAQSGELDGDSPVLMCATSAISAGSVSFTFNSETAIIGVTRFKLPADATITSIELEGVVTRGTIAVDGGGSLVLTPDGTRRSVTATGSWATTGQICNTAVYFASLPTADAYLVLNATDDSANEYANVSTIAQKTIEAGLYYYTEKILDAPVAEVAGVNYGTIDEAFAAANRATSAVTITLLADCSTAASLSIDSTQTGAVTLDLNGQTLTSTASTYGIWVRGARSLTVRDGAGGGKIASAAQYVIDVTGNAPDSTIKHFTLQSGAINSTYSGSSNSTALHLISNKGKFEVTGGSISATNSKFRGIYVGNGSTVNVNNFTVSTAGNCATVAKGTLNLNGGSFSREGDYCVYTSNAQSVVNIKGGTYSQTTKASALIYADYGEINVTGGCFNAVNIRPVTSISGHSAVARVTGGCFNKPLMNNVLTDANDLVYVNILNTENSTKEDYPFTVANVSKVATLTESTNSWDFGNIEGAMKGADVRATANGNSTVTLTDDCSAASTMSVSAGNTFSVILDLDGHVVSSTASPAISTGSTFTLTDSDSDGEVATTGTVALAVTAGTATVNGGSLYGATNAASVSSGASLTIIDGYFYGNGAADITGAGTVTVNGGYFRYSPASWCPASAAVTSSSELFNTRTYNYQVEYAAATVNGVGYSTLAAAAAATVAYDGEDATVTLQLQDDIEHNETLNITHASKPVVFDLNGHTLSTSTFNLFYPTSGTLTITDSQNKVGKITTSSYQAVYAGGTATILTISNCIIEGTLRKASESGEQALMLAGGTSNTTISGARIYTNGVQTVLKLDNTNCNVTINNSEMSSGIDTTASYYVVAHNNGNLTINSGSFYCKKNSVIQHTKTKTPQNMNTTINGGYFYSGDGAEYCLRANVKGSDAIGMVLNGGYMNMEPSGTKVSYGSGKSLQNCDVKHTHATTDTELTYTKYVTTTP